MRCGRFSKIYHPMHANETIEKLPPCRLNDQSVCPAPASADKHPSNRATYAHKEAPNRPCSMSFPRRRKFIFRYYTGITKKKIKKAWIPAFAGMTPCNGIRPTPTRHVETGKMNPRSHGDRKDSRPPRLHEQNARRSSHPDVIPAETGIHLQALYLNH